MYIENNQMNIYSVKCNHKISPFFIKNVKNKKRKRIPYICVELEKIKHLII